MSNTADTLLRRVRAVLAYGTAMAQDALVDDIDAYLSREGTADWFADRPRPDTSSRDASLARFTASKVPVLDHGHVRLVEYMGSDLSIVRNARVSYDAEWRTGEDAGKDEKLVRYLWKNKHTSPFEAVQFTFDIKCPIFVARQWHRHRTWAYNELSARYRELPEEVYVPALEQITTQSADNKQMRTTEQHAKAAEIAAVVAGQCSEAFRRYKHLLEIGCPRELARSVLPLATYTHFFATVDLRNLFHFLTLRLHPHAQWEIRQYAEALLRLITPVVPVAVAAFRECLPQETQ